MVCFRCYYKLGDKVLFISHAVNVYGVMHIAAYECVKVEQDKAHPSVLDNNYKPSGAPKLLSYDELKSAVNLNEACLKCMECKKILHCYPIENDGKELVEHGSCNGSESEVLRCMLHDAICPDKFLEMTPECEYFTPAPIKLLQVEDPPLSDIKAYFREVEQRHERHTYPSGIYVMPVDVFMHIIALLKEDEFVYFASGCSSRGENGSEHHDHLTDYLNAPGKDIKTVCVKAGDISKELYSVLISESGYNGFSCEVICIPALDFACFGDEELIDYTVYGYVICAPRSVVGIIEKATKST